MLCIGGGLDNCGTIGEVSCSGNFLTGMLPVPRPPSPGRTSMPLPSCNLLGDKDVVGGNTGTSPALSCEGGCPLGSCFSGITGPLPTGGIGLLAACGVALMKLVDGEDIGGTICAVGVAMGGYNIGDDCGGRPVYGMPLGEGEICFTGD